MTLDLNTRIARYWEKLECKILVGKLESKTPLARPRHRQKHKINFTSKKQDVR
jgi:hypothetical protein